GRDGDRVGVVAHGIVAVDGRGAVGDDRRIAALGGGVGRGRGRGRGGLLLHGRRRVGGLGRRRGRRGLGRGRGVVAAGRERERAGSGEGGGTDRQHGVVRLWEGVVMVAQPSFR